MTKASQAANRKTTIDPNEAAHFGALAADWWDPKGSSAMLHKLNPVRLGFVRRQIDRHFGTEETAMKPLSCKAALDVGCGAGLLCEPLARLGAAVTGVDAAAENIVAAKAHAEQSGLSIDYRAGELAAQRLGQFDLVTSMEVIEHVTEPAAFVGELAARLKPDGLMILSTPNRTAASKLFLVEAAERLGQVPRGTHDWVKFLTPDEVTALLADAGLQVIAIEGIAFSPLSGLHLSSNKALNYILAARLA
ncbi:bifunctional 2-polyprenyl-6-hydroxyphenol methylase/3-demethylubiquinol 3-O-methyltransferase UbiG [Sphingorhabdus sp.]|jgi:2-polyprenyl-6-hydroxyphenyl methylase/3-demethylubiquinone-9 3-methyltransferase|uniref:bifunctional 2-polyprenyl-6-hydroxyphenol methylase/3-demethylubiquinol 3-O-methyltransferase UbiG n=1 Tax=Sphingorhabdus sp. TaxID=1902408 RepID=UPI002C4F36A7|nr:bifunctional 2-polyprenyl-6-hydroxyphenol methylase/3-demethylubiquinol 3-O-methyltransferase UbiG [Sphingorhabdus sp.]HMT42209.1 bifunctional 2-polyprenyl-6-hydroxyphenol methylase/3-demethylubiquinol 3-O-methyltransferase UbiG [Sphingorhabdus sp.]